MVEITARIVENNKASSQEIDLNSIEDAVATEAQIQLKIQLGADVEIVPGLPQLLTPEMYLSSGEKDLMFAFGSISPCVKFMFVSASADFKNQFDFSSQWVAKVFENVWGNYYPNVVCRLGDWSFDNSNVRRLPTMLNLRFLRYSAFVYRNGKAERAGFFDTLSVY